MIPQKISCKEIKYERKFKLITQNQFDKKVKKVRLKDWFGIRFDLDIHIHSIKVKTKSKLLSAKRRESVIVDLLLLLLLNTNFTKMKQTV